ncbi:MAG: cobalamin-dependent protein [Betaproteobacteria bacterium]|nr:cobalamin-dependent protein [Betaproteobacteria bacterium]
MTAAKDRLFRLARAIESDVIPRLVQAHRASETLLPVAPKPTEADVRAFVADIVGDREDAVAALLDRLRQRGLPVEMLYLDLLAPAARLLGEMWSDDECDFATVTVALGRLQCLLRELSPAFGTEVAHPPNGRRALFAQPRDEQHSFGLSMVAEFFRRDGWEVVGGVGGAVDDPGARTRQEWVDVVGFSIGSELRLEWLRTRISAVRESSRNRQIVVLVRRTHLHAAPAMVDSRRRRRHGPGRPRGTERGRPPVGCGRPPALAAPAQAWCAPGSTLSSSQRHPSAPH